MKKFFATLLAAALVLASVNPVTAKAAETKVYVTVSHGDIKMVQEEVTVTDVDKDGKLTINDALYIAHKNKFASVSEGYGSAKTQWGLSITKLWGEENGGSYGYYVNNKAANSLDDPVKNGDYIYAYVYTDTTAFSDAYSYFDVNTVTYNRGENITLTLTSIGFDANWQPVSKPVSGAVITIDSERTSYKTDSKGKVTFKVTANGIHVVSAVSDTENLVPPTCIVTSGSREVTPLTMDPTPTPAKTTPAVTGTPSSTGESDKTPKTGDNTHSIILVLSLIAVCGIAVSMVYGKKEYDK